ncbi:hypothetical protein [Microvirga sp. VF16]|uniref:hypothetical protein n=1 Tax=Microvirga sp. VF16 TaxID=2807101 RepID=UPI00193E0D52|nr:hypothetical protein [Microvirga sp. VF16]QRM35575.1 hypothetical protein JO965_45445 [Microvirga sp. VF16]
MKLNEDERQRKLGLINDRLARHEAVTRITLICVLILAGLALAVLAAVLFDNSTLNIR